MIISNVLSYWDNGKEVIVYNNNLETLVSIILTVNIAIGPHYSIESRELVARW